MFKESRIDLPEGVIYDHSVINIPFNNFKGLKLFSRFWNLFSKLKGSSNSVFIVYSIHLPFLLAVYLRKLFGRGNRIVVIVPDLPEFMNSKVSFFKAILLKIQKFFLENFIYKNVDGFVLLTYAMNERLGVSPNKIAVIEGIFDPDLIENGDYIDDSSKFKILYTGTLDLRYGIEELLIQFRGIDRSINAELVICGGGDQNSIDLIKDYCNEDSRIVFKGQLQRDEVLFLQRQASLLVNPRRPEEFTKFSFPSKTMEYFASGTPVLMYKLDGIPDDYYEYCYTIDDKIDSDLKNKILMIMTLSSEERKSMGIGARNFILSEKNEVSQVKKLCNLLENFD